jgi:energy-coupling factor transporter transmembrane protein EcfT
VIHGASFAPAGVRPTPLAGLHPAAALGGLVLGIIGSMTLPPGAVVVNLVLLAAGLGWTGLGPGRQLAALRPWLFIALLVLVVHTLTTVEVAPLGRPSWTGLVAGLVALARVGCTVAWLGLYLRVVSLDDLVTGLGWWLRPLARLGVPVSDLGLLLAVALGTAPVVLGEGRRIRAVLRLRRTVDGEARPGRWTRWRRELLDRARVVVPLLEALARRGEALTLTLRRRRPEDRPAGPLPVVAGLLLAVWTVLLVLALVLRGGAG